jgi:isocitrate/isopropylmalate dehydrogenase
MKHFRVALYPGDGIGREVLTAAVRVLDSMFEPVHGSAPDIVGRGIANPVAAILSGAMMLDWLGLEQAGSRVRTGVENALAAGDLTPDLGGRLTTTEMTDKVITQIPGRTVLPI